jgi:hypothetical protein
LVTLALFLSGAVARAALDIGAIPARAHFDSAAGTIRLEFHGVTTLGTPHGAVGHEAEPLGGFVHG